MCNVNTENTESELAELAAVSLNAKVEVAMRDFRTRLKAERDAFFPHHSKSLNTRLREQGELKQLIAAENAALQANAERIAEQGRMELAELDAVERAAMAVAPAMDVEPAMDDFEIPVRKVRVTRGRKTVTLPSPDIERINNAMSMGQQLSDTRVTRHDPAVRFYEEFADFIDNINL